MPVITPLQLRLARTALRMSIIDLADAARVSPTTVTRFENGRAGMYSSTLDRVQAALEARGVIFIPADATGGPTIRLREAGEGWPEGADPPHAQVADRGGDWETGPK